MVDLSVNPELLALVPEPISDDYDALMNSIKTNGQLEPIVVWKESVSGKNYIIDGHTRYKILREFKIEPKIKYDTFSNWDEAKQYSIRINRDRRHLSSLQKVDLAFKEIEIEKKLAEKRQKETIPKPGQKGFQKSKLPLGISTGRTVDIVAKKTGLSPRTVSRINLVREKGSEELRKKVAEGKKSPAAAEKIIRREEIRTNPIPLPDGKFRIILCDVPYQYERDVEGSPDYPTLSTEEIIGLRDKNGKLLTEMFASSAIIFFWAPMPKLEEALQILKAWGFTYKTSIVWSKERDGKSQEGVGYYIKATCELLLIATKGKIGIPNPKDRSLGIIRAERTIHSQKPDIARRRIMSMYPNEKYLELFARKPVNGWTCWGNQIELPDTEESKTTKQTLDNFKS